MKNFLEQMSEDILREAAPDRQRPRGFLQNVGRAISSGIQAVKGWAKRVFTKTLRTLGIGIAQTKNNRFNVFNKNGEKLLPRDVKKITTSTTGKTVVLQDRGTMLQVSSEGKPTFGIKSGKGAAVVKVFGNMSPAGVSESTYKNITNVLNEYVQDDAELDAAMNFGDEDEEDYRDSLEGLLDVNTGHVDYKQLEDALDETIDGLHASTNDNITISLVGDSGIGKTQIIKSIAQDKQTNFFYVELGKIDPSLIKGIPVAGSSYKKDDQGNDVPYESISLLMAEEIFPKIKEEVSKGNMGIEEGSSDKWIIFLDEFNRADTRVTSVIMNLFLDGMITAAIKSEMKDGKLVNTSSGGSIRLPKNSVYVVGMNESAEQGSTDEVADLFQAVEALDLATTSRIAHAFILNADLEGWSDNFAALPSTAEYKKDGKEVDVIVYPQIPNILQKFMRKLNSERGDKGGVFTMPFASSMDNLAKMDPRRWAAIGKEFYRLAWIEWNKLPESKQYSEFNKKIAWQHYKMMQRNRDAMDTSTAKTSRASKRKYDKTLRELKGKDKEEIQKELAFTAWAANSLPLAQKLLNKHQIVSMFGVGLANDEGSREKNIKDFLRGMQNWIVKEANASVPPEQFIFGYDAMKRGHKNPDMQKLSTKIKKVYDVDVKTGERESTLLETTEIATKINSFFDAIQMGTTKKVEITDEFTVNGKSVQKPVPGNYIFAKRILGAGSSNKNPLTLDIIHADKKQFDKYAKESTYGFSDAVKTKLNAAKEAKSLYGKLEKVIHASLKMISENILHIVKDFSDNSEDIVEAIVMYLGKIDNSGFDNTDKMDIDEKLKQAVDSRTLFNTPYSELLVMMLNNDEDFKNLGGTQKSKEARATKKATDASNFADLPESTFKKLLGELLD